MNQLYIVEKIKNKWYVNLLGYSILILILLVIFAMLGFSFLFSNAEFSIDPLTLAFIIGANLLQIIIFVYYLNFRLSSNKVFKSNIAANDMHIAKAYKSLDENQKLILTQQHNLSYSMHRAFVILIPLFAVFDIFLTYTIFRNGVTFFTIMPSLFALMLQLGMIKYGMHHTKYYLDLINPTYHIKGPFTKLGKNDYINVNDINFPLGYIQETEILNKIYRIKDGQTVEIIYSPHSKRIWNIETIED